MPFSNAGGILQLIASYRLIWISGRFSGGKTSFAFRVAQEYLEKGYRLITNAQSVWSDNWDDVKLSDKGKLHAVVLMDEAGLELKATKQVEAMAAYANKMDLIFIFPSFFPPIRMAQVVTIQPVANFVQVGLPVIVYKWRAKLGAFQDEGHFLWITPSEIWGVYSRNSPQKPIGSLIAFLASRVEEFKKQSSAGDDDTQWSGYAHADEVSDLETGVSENDILRDSALALADAADTFSSVSVGRNKRRRF